MLLSHSPDLCSRSKVGQLAEHRGLTILSDGTVRKCSWSGACIRNLAAVSLVTELNATVLLVMLIVLVLLLSIPPPDRWSAKLVASTILLKMLIMRVPVLQMHAESALFDLISLRLR